jgi:hypothetical protein
MNEDITTDNAPGILLALADQVEGNPQAREAIAAGFRVIAVMWMVEAEQATETEPDPDTIDPDDNPATGADAGAGANLGDAATGPGLEGVQ